MAGVKPRISWNDRIMIMLVILAASVFPVDLQPGTGQVIQGANGQLSGRQGEVLRIDISVDRPPVKVLGHFLTREIPFFPTGDTPHPTQFVGLLGIDMQDAPGTHELVVDVQSLQHNQQLSYNVLVVKKAFPVQKLTLPKSKVDLNAKSLARVRGEQRRVRKVLGIVSDQKLWKDSFVEPVQGKISGAFGRKRVINGQPKNPHSGEDIAAPKGTNVLAMNDGIVRLTADHFFSGKGLFIDHGLGLISMYFHLSKVSVKDGERVRRGQPVGKVGATGRATGPHLHWGVRLNGARVDPYSLVRLSAP